MQSAKHKLSTRRSLLFQSYRERSMQAQFLPDTVMLEQDPTATEEAASFG